MVTVTHMDVIIIFRKRWDNALSNYSLITDVPVEPGAGESLSGLGKREVCDPLAFAGSPAGRLQPAADPRGQPRETSRPKIAWHITLSGWAGYGSCPAFREALEGSEHSSEGTEPQQGLWFISVWALGVLLAPLSEDAVSTAHEEGQAVHGDSSQGQGL